MARRRRPPRSGAIAELPPLRILSQIALLQVVYYTAALVLMAFTSVVAGWPFTLDMVFGWESLRGDTSQGWLVAFTWLCCAGAVIVALVIFIARSKLVLDFALTLHFIHLVVVCLYTGVVPKTAMWWGTALASTALTFLGGSYGCQWRELQPIYFGSLGGGGSTGNGGGSSSSNNNNNTASGSGAGANGDASGDRLSAPGVDGDEEMGFSRGRGRGRGRDGGGEYEMVGLKGGEEYSK